ncbi:MAG: hypothetical protein AB7O73_05620, partial [Bacteroidia bacterium]
MYVNSFKITNKILILLSVLIFVSCNSTKKLKGDQFLLEGSKIHGYKETGIPLEEFQAFEKQKPNRKFLKTIPFYVWWYNLYNDSTIQLKKEARNLKYDRINAKRIAKANKKNKKRIEKGKKPVVPKLLNKEELTLRESFRNIGEAPVIFDTVQANQTARQLRKFLFNKGYFDNRVDWCVDVNEKNFFGKIKKNKAFLNFQLQTGNKYIVSELYYSLKDTAIKELFYSDTSGCLIVRGDRYDAGVLQLERERITKFLVNKGYYYFDQAFVHYSVDTNLAGNNVSVKLILDKFAKTYSSSSDSIVFVNHAKYKIGKIYVFTEPVVGNIRDLYFNDTTFVEGYDFVFLHNQPMKFKASLLADFIKLRSGAYFNRDTAEATFKSLMGIGVFKGVSVQFRKSDEYPKELDCYIICTPLIRQSITAETEGINTFGNLGVDGSIIYRNKNLFKGAEVFQFKLQGALTAQSQLGGESSTDFTQLHRITRLFNTFQFGPELTFSVPRAFFPFSLLPFKNEMAPHTFFKASVNYQARSTFVRNIVSFENGLSFKSRDRLFDFFIVPFEIYSVKADLTTEFKDQLGSLNDAFLLNSFIDHITTLSKFGVSHVSKLNSVASKLPVHHIKWDIMSSGNILRTFYNLSGKKTDSLGRYNLFGIPFAHFIKTELEYKIYIPVHR